MRLGDVLSGKLVLNESDKFAAMPRGLLHSKTKSIIGDNEYDHSDTTMNDAGGKTDTFVHKFDPRRHEDDDEGDDQMHYHMHGPDQSDMGDRLKSLGWSHSPIHSHYVETPNARVSTMVYNHPSGSTLHKLSIYHANDDPHHSWSISHPRENA